jgi:hypothetical protein
VIITLKSNVLLPGRVFRIEEQIILIKFSWINVRRAKVRVVTTVLSSVVGYVHNILSIEYFEKLSKVIPVKGRRGLYGYEMLSIPHCIRQSAHR